jgi:hypothetical protein
LVGTRERSGRDLRGTESGPQEASREEKRKCERRCSKRTGFAGTRPEPSLSRIEPQVRLASHHVPREIKARTVLLFSDDRSLAASYPASQLPEVHLRAANDRPKADERIQRGSRPEVTLAFGQ